MNGGGAESPEETLFGQFFQNVSQCLHFMEMNSTIAAGGPVLAAVSRDLGWRSNEIWFFSEKRTLGTEGLMQWHEYFLSQGYSLGLVQVTHVNDEVGVLLLVHGLLLNSIGIGL
jgi:hypothetical protein